MSAVDAMTSVITVAMLVAVVRFGSPALLAVAVTGAVWMSLHGGGQGASRALRDSHRRRLVPHMIALAKLAHGRLRFGGAARQRDRVTTVRAVVTAVVALLRAGAPPGAAWTRAAGVDVDELGVPDASQLAVSMGPAAASAVASATRLALTVGAPLGRVLTSVCESLAEQAQAEAQREAALAGPRTTAKVLLWLPVAGVLLGWLIGIDPIAVATDAGVGSAAVCAGVLLLLVGRTWTNRLVTAARQAGEPA